MRDEAVERVRGIVDPSVFRARLDNGATFVSPEEADAIRTLLAERDALVARTAEERVEYDKTLRAVMEDREEVQSRHDALVAEVAALRADRDRLDWLGISLATLHCNFCHPNDFTVTVEAPDFSAAKEYHGDTVRAALDAAKEG